MQEIHYQRVIIIVPMVFYSMNSRRDENFGTIQTRKMGNIRSRAKNGDPSLGSIRDGVLFSMDGCLFMAVTHVADVWRARQKSIVSCRDDPVALLSTGHKHTSDMQPFTCGTKAHQKGCAHEILIPTGPFIAIQDQGFDLFDQS